MTTIINKLPLEIIREIECYFVTQEQYDQMLDWWNKNYTLNCSSAEIENHMNYLLKDKQAIEYLGRKNEYFTQVYEKHFIHKKKTFLEMDKTNSLITEVLFLMWH